jgi:ABC-type sugar transport system permease subunit
MSFSAHEIRKADNLTPTTAACLIFVYGFILWTAWISFTKSRLLPCYDWSGFFQSVTPSPSRWR